MKLNHWTLALAAAGVVTMGTVAQAEEATESVKTLVSGTTISGYVSTSAIWRPGTAHDTGAALNSYPLGGFHGGAKHDGFNLDVVDVTISKSLDESEWASGYNAEIWYGPDAATLGTLAGTGQLAIKNGYVALRAPVGNGINFKMGVFDTLIGYEANNASENPNFTRGLAWALAPTTHTGLLASYRFNDLVAVTAGVVNTRGPAVNARFAVATVGQESSKGYTGAIELTAPEGWGFLSGSKLTASVLDSPAVGPDTLDLNVGATLNTPVDALKVGLNWYYRGNAGTGSAFGAPAVVRNTDYANVWSLYTSYQATEKLTFNVRGEYASATENTFSGVAPLVAGNTDDDAGEQLVSATATVDYKLWENVISRLEFRWDTVVSGGGEGYQNAFGGTAAGGPLGDRDEKNAFLVALNVIYKF